MTKQTETSSPRSWRKLASDREVLSWSLYDWANSSFATTVMAGFFPVFFKKFWSAGADVNVSTFQLGFANSFASAILAFMAPILGAIADQGSRKKGFLLLFTAMGVITTGALSLVAQGDWPLAVLLYVFASIGFAGSNSFYDALIVFVAKPAEFNAVSSLGFSLGYLGGGLLFAVNVLMTLKPHLFGLQDSAQAVQISFITVAVWWTLFTVPLLLFVKEEKDGPAKSYWMMARGGVRQITQTFREIRALKNIGLFLIAYFFYIDGVNTIIRMSVDYGMSLGFPSESLIIALLITQFVGFPSALIYSHLTHKIGARAALFLAIGIYTGVNIFAFWMNSTWHFYILAIVIGLVMGGIQSLSRSVFGAMIPKGKAGEFFGFFNMLGKFSSMVGPILVGLVSVTTQSSRLSILSIIVLFLIGAAVLTRVEIPEDHP